MSKRFNMFGETPDDVIRKRDARIGKLEAALRPFADWAAKLDDNYTTAGYPNDCPMALSPDQPNRSPTVGDLRRARALLGSTGGNHD